MHNSPNSSYKECILVSVNVKKRMLNAAEGLLIGFPFGRTVATSVVPAFGGPRALRQLWHSWGQNSYKHPWKIAEKEP